ncbi:MAG: hypothetical protein IKP73_05940 [Bacteroidales bacterium]|nr:hypothetical protein [Bacteroidales bacterium]MBR4625036.1 hypothetical protein [Alphaproteobacteria bacterium]
MSTSKKKAQPTTSKRTLEETVTIVETFMNDCQNKAEIWKGLYFASGFIAIIANIIIAYFLNDSVNEADTIKALGICIIATSILHTAISYFGFYNRFKYNDNAAKNSELLKEYFEARLGIFSGKQTKDELCKNLNQQYLNIKEEKFKQMDLADTNSLAVLNSHITTPNSNATNSQ